MQVNLNNVLTLGDSRFIIEKITGLGSADIRTSQFLFSGRDGGLVTDQYLGFRQIDVSGKLLSDTCDLHQQDRRDYLNATPIGVTIPVYITLFNGETYVVYCRVTKPLIEFTGAMESDFMLQLLAGDPLFYSTEGGDLQSANIQRVQDNGGYVTPYDLPVDWQMGGQPTIVTNSGNATVYPVITLNNVVHNPTITNQATGETVELTLSTVPGDQIIIDMFNRTVKLNGSNILGNKTDDNVWWGLLPGANPILLNTNSASDDVTGTVTWRNGLTGI